MSIGWAYRESTKIMGGEKVGKKEITEKDLLFEINRKLEKLIGILAIQGKNRDEKIKTLASLGFSNSEISKIICIPKGTVDFIRAKSKKKNS
jgi:Holliday junction resolvasome RuvABC DNA-binding subunit